MTSFPSLALSQQRARVSKSAQGSSSTRSIEHWFVVIVFVLIASSLWFTSGEGNDAALQGSPAAELLWGIVYLCAAIGIVRNRSAFAVLLRESLPLLAIIGLVLISSLWSVDPSITIKRALGLCGTTAFSYYIASRFKLSEFLDILGLTCYIIIFLSFIAIILIPSMGTMQDTYVGAWRGIFTHKNSLGEFMALSMATFTSILVAKQWTRWTALGGLVLSTVLLIGSDSISACAIALLLLAVVCLAALYRRSDRSRTLATTLGVLLLFGIAGALLDSSIRQDLLNLVGRDPTLTGRTDLWPQVIQAISNRPVLGYGYGAFWLPNGAFNYFINWSWTPAHAHNGYLELCLDVGLLGAGIALTAILVGVRRALLLFRSTLSGQCAWPLLMMVYFITVNLTEANIAKYNNFSWVLFTIAYLTASRLNAIIGETAAPKTRPTS